MEEQIYSPGMQEILSVNMFSGFSMTYAGKKIAFSRSSNMKFIQLLLLLFLHADQGISKKELIEKIQRTTSKEAAWSAADRMEELGLVNDEEFAKRYAAELFNRKGFSGRRAQYELLRKGIDKEIIAQVVEELEPNPVEKIKEIIEKKYLRCLQDEKGYRRTVNGLQRLGYRYEDIKQAILCFSCEGDEDIYYE